ESVLALELIADAGGLLANLPAQEGRPGDGGKEENDADAEGYFVEVVKLEQLNDGEHSGETAARRSMAEKRRSRGVRAFGQYSQNGMHLKSEPPGRPERPIEHSTG